MKDFRPEEALGISLELRDQLSNVEVEGTLLGCILVDGALLPELMGAEPPLTPLIFTDQKYREISKAMIDLYDAVPRQVPDVISVTEQLRKNDTLDFVGQVSMYGLAENVLYTSAYDTYFHQLQELHTRRLGVALANRVLQASLSGEHATLTQDILSWTNLLINPMADLSAVVAASEGVIEADRDIQEVRERGDHIVGMTSGFREIDEHLGGFPAGELSVVLGDTSMGKTQMGLQIVVHGAQIGFTPLIFSMEMTKKSLVQRLIANRMGVSVLDLKRAQLTDQQWEEYEVAKAWVSDLDLYIDDTSAMTASDLRARAMRSYGSLGVRFILVDYLQLMIPEQGSKGDDWSYAVVTHSMRELHTLARSLNAHVMVLANTHRGIVNSPDKRPEKHHGSGSGAIEKYSDFMFGLFRRSVYHPADPLGRNLGEFRILKFRNGPTGDIEMGWGIETGDWLDRDAVTTALDDEAGAAGIEF